MLQDIKTSSNLSLPFLSISFHFFGSFWIYLLCTWPPILLSTRHFPLGVPVAGQGDRTRASGPVDHYLGTAFPLFLALNKTSPNHFTSSLNITTPENSYRNHQKLSQKPRNFRFGPLSLAMAFCTACCSSASVEIPVDDMVETKMPVVNRRNREELTAAT